MKLLLTQLLEESLEVDNHRCQYTQQVIESTNNTNYIPFDRLGCHGNLGNIGNTEL